MRLFGLKFSPSARPTPYPSAVAAAPETKVVCPQCGTARPNFRMMEMTSHSISGDQVIERITGYRVACQNCPAVYAIDAHGTFMPHEHSLPPIPPPALRGFTRRDGPPSAMNGTLDEMRDAASQHLPLKPRERPRA